MRREGSAVSFRAYADDLDRKLALARFRADVRDVLATDVAYDVHAAAALVHDVFLPHLPGGAMAAATKAAHPVAALAG